MEIEESIPPPPQQPGGALLGLLDNAKNPAIVNKIYDIIACNTRTVVKDIEQPDLEILSAFFDFPKGRKQGSYNLKAGREMIENFIRAYPAFRSVNAQNIITWIVAYHSRHPEVQHEEPNE